VATWKARGIYRKDDTFRIVIRRYPDAASCFEYDDSHEAVLIDESPRDPHWQAVAAVDALVHRRYLFGSERRERLFFAALDAAHQPFSADSPLHHSVYGDLLDCAADATARFREYVIEPITQTVLIGGLLQWAWHYRSRGLYRLAVEHLDAACGATEQATPTIWFSQEQQSERLLFSRLLRAECLASIAVDTDASSEDVLRKAGDDLRSATSWQNTYRYALTTYRLAVAHLHVGRSQLGSGRDAHLQAAEDHFTLCVLAFDPSELNRPGLYAASLVGLANVANTRAHGTRPIRRGPSAVTQLAERHASDALDALVGSDGPQYDLVRGAAWMERGDLTQARGAWARTTEASSSPVLAAAGIFNRCIAASAEGEWVDCCKLASQLYLIAPGFRSSYFRQIRRIVLSYGISLPPPVAEELERHIDAGSNGHPFHATLRQLQRFNDLGSTLTAVVQCLDVPRLRRSAHAVDFLAFHLGVQVLSTLVLHSSSNPLTTTRPFPLTGWRSLSAETRWTLIGHLIDRECECLNLRNYERFLCEAVVAEYDRLVFARLRLRHRLNGHSEWRFISAPSSTGPWWKDLFAEHAELPILEALIADGFNANFEGPLADSLRALEGACPDEVGLLFGCHTSIAGIWNGSTTAQLAEKARLERAFFVLRQVRNARTHSIRADLPSAEVADAARYLLTSALLAVGAVLPSDLGGSTVWDRQAGDPRAGWEGTSAVAI
jgi:hypothetical protein